MLRIIMTLSLTLLIETILLTGICLFMLCILLRSIATNPDTVLLLMANNYLAILVFAIVAISSNVDVVSAHYKVDLVEETLVCRIKGYLTYSCSAVIFNIFALQTAFRFFRVAYPSHVWLQYCRTYAIIIPILWILSFLFILPIHIWHDIKLIPDENACLLDIDIPRGFCWSTLVIYCLPITFIGIIYSLMVRCMYRPSIGISARAKRDLIVTRRIVLVVCILVIIYTPTIVMELMLPFTDAGRPLFYRITNMTLVTVMSSLSVMLVYVTPQVKQILLCYGKKNRVTPLRIWKIRT